MAARETTAPWWDGLSITSVRYGTLALVAVNVAVFLAAPWYISSWLRMQPIEIQARPIPFVLEADSMAIGGSGQWYRLVSANFLHITWDHLATNMVLLLVAGWGVESRFGTRLLVVAYVFTGTSALTAVYAFGGCTTSLGASAAVYGLFGLIIGSVLARAVHDRRVTPQARNVTIYSALFVILELVGVSLPGAAHLAHFWGFGAGLLIGLCSTGWGRFGRLPLVLALVALAMLAAALAVWRDATFACHV